MLRLGSWWTLVERDLHRCEHATPGLIGQDLDQKLKGTDMETWNKEELLAYALNVFFFL